MKFTWQVFDYQRDFPHVNVSHTRFSLVNTSFLGEVKLQLRVAWQMPLAVWSWQVPALAGVTLNRNWCRTFTVVLTNPHSALISRMFQYFDGPGTQVKTSHGAVVLFCDRKWAISATQLVNRYGEDQPRNRAALQHFMERRLINAFGQVPAV